MGRSSHSASSSVYSGNSSSTVSSSGWSRASGLSDVSQRGTIVRCRDVGKMNPAQKFMAWTLGIKVDNRKHHKVRAEMLEWQGIDAEGRLVTWYEKPELYWTTKGRYQHDDDEPRRPKSKASSRGHSGGGGRHIHAPQGRQMPGPQIRPGPSGPRGPGGGGAFMPGTRLGPGPMPMPMRPPLQQQHPPPPPPPPPPQQQQPQQQYFHPTPGPTPMPQGGPWPQPAGFQGDYDDGSSYTSEVSSYDSSDDGLAYGGPVDPGYAPGPPPPPPQGQFHHAGPSPPPPPVADNFGDGTAFIKL